ncbi:MarR family winged helix-turn-helix transcriptional regulator [Humibacter ginsengisoli]
MGRGIDFFDDLVRAEIAVYNQVDERIKAAHGVTVGTVNVLSLIERTENARVDDLVRALELRVGTASKIVDRYVEAGWLERVPNPGDRRSSWLVLTDAGRELLAAGAPTFEASVTDIVSGVLTNAETTQLHGLLAKLRAGLRGEQSS